MNKSAKRLVCLAMMLAVTLSVTAACADSGNDVLQEEYSARRITNFSNLCRGGELYLDSMQRLNFIDFTSMNSSLICPYPNCAHADPNVCPSFGMNICPVMYENNIYYFTSQVEYEADGPVLKTYINKADIDGTNRMQLAEYDNILVADYTMLLVYDDKFYFCPNTAVFDEYANMSTSDRSDMCLYSYSFTDNKFTMIEKLCEGYSCGAWIYGMYDGEIYMHVNYSEEPYDYMLVEQQDFTTEFLKYNPQDNTVSRLDFAVNYASGGYLLTSEGVGIYDKMTLHFPDGKTKDVPWIEDAVVYNGYIFDRISQRAYRISDDTMYVLNTDDFMTEVVGYENDMYILRSYDSDAGGYAYAAVPEEELIGSQV